MCDQINVSLFKKKKNSLKQQQKKSYYLQTSEWYCTITVNITHYYW